MEAVLVELAVQAQGCDVIVVQHDGLRDLGEAYALLAREVCVTTWHASTWARCVMGQLCDSNAWHNLVYIQVHISILDRYIMQTDQHIKSTHCNGHMSYYELMILFIHGTMEVLTRAGPLIISTCRQFSSVLFAWRQRTYLAAGLQTDLHVLKCTLLGVPDVG